MPDLKEWFRGIDQAPMPDLQPAIDHLGTAPRTSSQPSLARRVVIAVAALSIGLAGLLLVATALRPGDPATEVASSPPSASVPQGRDPAPLPHQSFPVDGTAGSIATGDGWVWVATNDYEHQGAILDKIDPSSGDVVASIPLPGHASFLAAGNGSVWAPVSLAGGSEQALLQIDVASNEIVDRLPGLSGPVVAAADGTVWAVRAHADDTAEIVHLGSGAEIGHVQIPDAPWDLVEAAGSIWALRFPSDKEPSPTDGLYRIEEASGSVTARLDVRSNGIWLAGNDQGVWLSSWLPAQRGSSVLVSSSDNSVTPFGNIYNFRPFAVAEDHVWFLAGPHDGPIQGLCGLNLETQVADLCADAPGPDNETARDPAAYEPTTNTLWAGVYLKSMITRVSLAG